MRESKRKTLSRIQYGIAGYETGGRKELVARSKSSEEEPKDVIKTQFIPSKMFKQYCVLKTRWELDAGPATTSPLLRFWCGYGSMFGLRCPGFDFRMYESASHSVERCKRRISDEWKFPSFDVRGCQR